MAFKCELCDKGPSAGKSISHSRRATNRRFLPNLQKIRVNLSGTVKRLYVCTTCLKSGKVQKSA
jgi:large subunit ribosomal protein L28